MENQNSLQHQSATALTPNAPQQGSWIKFAQTSKEISKSDIDWYHSNLPKFKDSINPAALVRAIKETLEKMIVVHLGIRPGLIDEELHKAVITEIVKKYPEFTLQDIEHSYNRFSFTLRDNWRNITKSEILQPLVEWRNTKDKISLEFSDFKKEEIQAEDDRKMAHDFLIESKKLYNDCVDALEWTGSIFQAEVIAPIVAKNIDKKIKKQLWDDSIEERNVITKNNAELKRLGMQIDISSIGKNEIRIYSNKIVIEGIKNGIKIETNE